MLNTSVKAGISFLSFQSFTTDYDDVSCGLFMYDPYYVEGANYYTHALEK